MGEREGRVEVHDEEREQEDHDDEDDDDDEDDGEVIEGVADDVDEEVLADPLGAGDLHLAGVPATAGGGAQ